jgi:hypothetical protein
LDGPGQRDNDDLKDTLPFVPTFDRLQEMQGSKPLHDTIPSSSPGDLHDTLPDPASNPDLHDTVPDPREGAAPLSDPALHDTLVEPEQPPRITDKPSDKLADTLLEVRPQEGGLRRPITFTEVPDRPIKGDPTGTAPLDFKEFESTDDIARRSEAERVQPEEGQTDLLPSGKALEDSVPWEQLGTVQSSGLAKLTKLLVVLASLAWIGLALLMLAPLLGVAVVASWIAALPFYSEVLVAVPGGLTLLTLLCAAGVRARASSLTGKGSWPGAFFGLLLWVLLSALPAVGVVLGLIGAIRLIVRRRLSAEELEAMAAGEASISDYGRRDLGEVDRSLGLLLLLLTLCWQTVVGLYVKPYLWPLLS